MKLKEMFITKQNTKRLHGVLCPVIGLTGGIATGKTSVSNKLRELGFNIICADKLVKDIYSLPETLEFINEEFPEVIKGSKIDFKELRKVAFSDTSNREKLEGYIYKRMPEAFHKDYSSFDKEDVLIYDVPLLFEKKMEELFDVTICVYSKKETQIERLIKRDNINNELAESILENQLPIDKKKELADFTIDNKADLDHLYLEVEALCTILFE